MSTVEEWAATEQLATPNVARMYDYYLGGYHNFAIDRQAAEAVLTAYPDFALAMRANRAFLRRVVSFLAAQGVTQFLDLGSGIPTVGNVHEVAQQANPAARVVYVDLDPVAVAHSEAILAGDPATVVLQGDVRHPEAILAHPTTRRLLDFRQPTAVLMLTVLHFVTDDAEALAAVQTLRDALAPGSYLVLSHGTPDHETRREVKERVIGLYRGTNTPAKPRHAADVLRFFAGFELVSPGLVYTPAWRPESTADPLHDRPAASATYAAVGRRP